MSKAVEIINALVSPANKLIDAVTGAIGKAYQPRHIRKVAEAKVHEINVVGQALRDNADVPIVYDKGELSLNTTDFDEFVKRTQSRLAYQELQKQQNIENVADKAYDLLSTETECSSEPVSQDWMTRFFNSVEDISDEDMQTLWARILAGEIKQPKSYSLRTLETLKNLSKHEAELFEKVATLATRMHGDLFLTCKTEILRRYEISYDAILCLDECGLINSDGMVSYNHKISINDSVAIFSKSKLLLLKGTSERPTMISIGVFGLTQAGKELYSILECDSNESYLCDFAEEIEKNNKGNVSITLHQIHTYDGENIRYNSLALREFPPRKDEEKE